MDIPLADIFNIMLQVTRERLSTKLTCVGFQKFDQGIFFKLMFVGSAGGGGGFWQITEKKLEKISC
jgi:hypothetical protein